MRQARGGSDGETTIQRRDPPGLLGRAALRRHGKHTFVFSRVYHARPQ